MRGPHLSQSDDTLLRPDDTPFEHKEVVLYLAIVWEAALDIR